MLERAWIDQTLATLACEIYANPILDSKWEDVGVFAIGILEVKHPHILLDIPSGRSRRALGFLGRTTLFGLVILLRISGWSLVLALLFTGSGWNDNRLG